MDFMPLTRKVIAMMQTGLKSLYTMSIFNLNLVVLLWLTVRLKLAVLQLLRPTVRLKTFLHSKSTTNL